MCSASEPTAAEWLLEHLLLIVISAAVLGIVGFGLHRLVQRQRRHRRNRPTSWAGAVDAQLTSLGARAGMTLNPGDTAGAYDARVADRYGEDRLRAAGRAVDDALYVRSPSPLPSEQRVVIDALLGELAAAEVPPDPSLLAAAARVDPTDGPSRP